MINIFLVHLIRMNDDPSLPEDTEDNDQFI